MNPPEQNRRRYLPPLDGIRAIAILGVLIFHVSPAALRGGFTGVDVFFVLSGFLITSILLADFRAGHFSFREFYLRRIQRLLPNAVLTVLVVLLLWFWLMPPHAAVQPAVHGLWTLFNLSNVYIWKNLGGYWGDAAESAPLTHFWSLGIEEQFYLLFPVSLWLLARRQPGRLRFWLLLATVCSFGLCLYGTTARPTSTFYLLPTRIWELLLGAVLAAGSIPPLSARNREWAGWVGLGLVVVGFFCIGESGNFPGLVVLAPTMGTALLLGSVAAGETRVSRLLSTRPMVGLGKVSYSLYLWHWPLIILGKIQADLYGVPQHVGAMAGGAMGGLFAWAAYVSVEQPLRERGPGRTRRLVAIAVGFGVAVTSCVVIANRPVNYDPGQRFERPAFRGKLYDAGRAAAARDLTATSRYADTHFPTVPPPAGDPWRTGGIVHRFGGDEPKVVVFGSSHALMYARLIDDICRERRISVAFLCVDHGTPAFFETTVNPNFPTEADARAFDAARKKWLEQWRPAAVFVIDRWDARVEKPPGFEVRLRQFLQETSPHAGRVVFVSQIPTLRVGKDVNLRGFVSWRMRAAETFPRVEPDANESLRRQAVASAEAARNEFKNLRVLRVDRPFAREDGSVRYAEGRIFFYADDNHLTDAGSERVRDLFEAAIAEASAATR